MDKTTAQNIGRETFKASFGKKRDRDFINELCNGIDETKAIPSMAVPDAFALHIKTCQRLGTFESPDGELTDVLVVHLTEFFKLERTRTALRDFVAHKLKRDERRKEAASARSSRPIRARGASRMSAWNTRQSATRAPARSSPRSG